MSAPQELVMGRRNLREAVVFVQMERGGDLSWQEFRGYFLEIRVHYEQATWLELTMTVLGQDQHPATGTPRLEDL